MITKRQMWVPVTRTYTSIGREIVSHVTIDMGNTISFDDIRRCLDEVEEEFGDQFERFTVEHTEVNDYGSTYIEYRVMGFRDETDKELSNRIIEGAKRDQAAADRELKEFERLKAKLGMK